MLKILVTTLIAAALGTAPAAGAAPPKLLKATALQGGTATLGAAGPQTFAAKAPDGSVALFDDAGVRRTLGAPAGCRPGAAGSGLVAWTCEDAGAQTHSALVTDLAGSVRARIPIDAPRQGWDPQSIAIGTQWIAVMYQGEKLASTVWINWHTGLTGDVDGTDVTTRPVPDAPSLVVPFCDGVTAQLVKDLSRWVLRPVQLSTPWAVVDRRFGRPDPSNPVRHRLLRCGSSRALPVPSSFTSAQAVVLGRGWVAWVPRGSSSTHLMRLRDRRRFVVHAASALRLTDGSLWLAARGGREELLRATLPR